ncbi:MAG: dockerin type I domain-containing protein [Pirellulaceae bacterium]
MPAGGIHITACDVNDSGIVSPIDALLVINRLNRSGSGALLDRGTDSTEPYYDTNGDGSVSAIDALLVLNLLNRVLRRPCSTLGLRRGQSEWQWG